MASSDPPRSSSPVPLPLLLGAVSLASVAVGVGISYGLLAGQVAANREGLASLKIATDAHHAMPNHQVTQVQLEALGRGLTEIRNELERERGMAGELRAIRADVAALCRATRAANCAP